MRHDVVWHKISSPARTRRVTTFFMLCLNHAINGRLLLARLVKGALTYAFYVYVVDWWIADVIMGWKDAGKLAWKGDNYTSVYGRDWTQGEWSTEATS